MAEYRVQVWRRKQSRVRPLHVKVEDVETDTVSVEASDENSALEQALRAEYAENPDKRFRALVRVSTSGGGRGLGDYGLMRYLDEAERVRCTLNDNG